jgi:hypothetical protein
MLDNRAQATEERAMSKKTGETRGVRDKDRVVLRALQTMPNVGPAMAEDLLRLGIRSPGDLIGRDPDEMYDELGRLDGIRHDPCVRDIFAAVVSYAETGRAAPWWHFTPIRKARDKRTAKS